MTRRILAQFAAFAPIVLGALTFGCQSGGVGDPCTPEDEYQKAFAGYKASEVNIESRSFQCETRLCLVNHFQGRTSCPYGQDKATVDALPTDATRAEYVAAHNMCTIPGTSDEPITVPVDRGCENRKKSDAVYCSCRCAGPDPNAKYCDCPSGYECKELLKDIGLGSKELSGSYCVKAGTAYDTSFVCSPACDRAAGGCGAGDGTSW